MASQSASQASTSFGRLLKSSKVVSRFDASIPLVYTTHGGSKKRSDYGLKRALPKIKTAAIRVHSLDNSMTKLTDFSYAAREHCFVEGFRESNVKVGGHASGSSPKDHKSRLTIAGEKAGGCAWDKKGFQSIEDLKSIAKTGRSLQKIQQSAALRTEKAFNVLIGSGGTSAAPKSTLKSQQHGTTHDIPQFAPNYLEISDSQFNKLLVKLEDLRPKFIDFLSTEGLIEPNPTRQQLCDIYDSLNTVGSWGGIINDFLAKEMPAKDPKTGKPLAHDPKLDRLAPSEHYAFGLTYAVPNLYMSDQATRPLPLRYLDAPLTKDAAFTGRTGAPATVLGTLTNVARNELPDTPTVWQADSQGNYLIEYGRGAARVESASIQHPSTRTRRPTPDDTLYGVEVDLVDNPSKRPTVMDEDVIDLQVYKAGEAEGSLKPKRVGSPEWVGTALERISMEDNIRSGNVSAVFNMQRTSQGNVQRRIRPPTGGRYVGDSHIKGRKHQIQSQSQTEGAIDPSDILARLGRWNQSNSKDDKKDKADKNKKNDKNKK